MSQLICSYTTVRYQKIACNLFIRHRYLISPVVKQDLLVCRWNQRAIVPPLFISQNQRMQQPLAHLYFLTLLEHLQAQERKLSGLTRIAKIISQQCASPATEEVKKVILWVELQAVVQVVLRKLANHLDPSKPHLGEIKLLMDDINR